MPIMLSSLFRGDHNMDGSSVSPLSDHPNLNRSDDRREEPIALSPEDKMGPISFSLPTPTTSFDFVRRSCIRHRDCLSMDDSFVSEVRRLSVVAEQEDSDHFHSAEEQEHGPEEEEVEHEQDSDHEHVHENSLSPLDYLNVHGTRSRSCPKLAIIDHTDESISPSRTLSFNDIDKLTPRGSRSESWPQYGHRIKKILIMNVKHQVIAEQLTFMMHAVYRHIDFSRFTTNDGEQCDHSDKSENCYFSAKYIEMFNQTVKWVQFSILEAINCKERARIIKKWVKCCHFLLELRNFHGLVAVNCALRSTAVFSGRLETAWSSFPFVLKRKHHRLFEHIGQLLSYRNNYKALRDEMAKESSLKLPTLPYWGIWKRDCVWIEELRMDHRERKMEELVNQYSGYKGGRYNDGGVIGEDKLIQCWIHHQLKNMAIISELEMLRMSDGVRTLDGDGPTTKTQNKSKKSRRGSKSGGKRARTRTAESFFSISYRK